MKVVSHVQVKYESSITCRGQNLNAVSQEGVNMKVVPHGGKYESTCSIMSQ